MTRHRTQVNRTPVFAYVVQISDAMDIDQIFGPRHAKLHHRHEALAAGQKLGVVAVAAKPLDRLARFPWLSDIRNLPDT